MVWPRLARYVRRFSDLSYSEFAAKYLMKINPLTGGSTTGRRLLADDHPGPEPFGGAEEGEPGRQLLQAVPSNVDWRVQGRTTAVRDQGGCGSCWAFAATSAVESAYLIATVRVPACVRTFAATAAPKQNCASKARSAEQHQVCVPCLDCLHHTTRLLRAGRVQRQRQPVGAAARLVRHAGRRLVLVRLRRRLLR